ncbi:MAG: DAK2 domain-containing protein [Oscillospiraceae bacterium]|nr:DAK2 domain-containing protein [Oscillospiraceae bacterium]
MISGKMLKDAFLSGAAAIANNKRAVDELNVYPVPDGDTGTNMSMTMSNAQRELQFMDDNCTVAQVSSETAAALLRGARGNSGVILSLLFRGFSKALKGKTSADCKDLANALDLGVKGAYKAVMNPTEGTILTVARLASEKAAALAETADDVSVFWGEICDEADKALAQTPELLPVLKKAGVVDAGGKGLIVIWRAMLEVFSGGKGVSASQSDNKGSVQTAVGDFDEEINFTYCTEFIVNKTPESPDVIKLRAYLETIGDCVVAVDDDDIIKVHVHTDHPGNAIEEGLKFGPLTNLKIDNMRHQHENKAKEAAVMKVQKFTPAAPENKYGFVAVASGAGVEEMFRNLGVDNIVTGGQTMNPSTDDILQAILATPAETVFVLPNNKNIIMAAEQAVKLADRRVCVLQTKTIPQGMTAMLNFDPEGEFEDNRLNMSKSIENVSTGLVTFAARDSDLDGKEIRKGEILGLENGKLNIIEKDVTKAAYKLIKKMTDSSTGFITIIYGADVTDENAEALNDLVQNKFGDKCEIMLINGGQPVYYYIISVE